MARFRVYGKTSVKTSISTNAAHTWPNSQYYPLDYLITTKQYPQKERKIIRKRNPTSRKRTPLKNPPLKNTATFLMLSFPKDRRRCKRIPDPPPFLPPQARARAHGNGWAPLRPRLCRVPTWGSMARPHPPCQN